MIFNKRLPFAALLAVALAFMFAPSAVAEDDDNDPVIIDMAAWHNFQKLSGMEDRLQPHGSDLMGDIIDKNTGAISFEHLDVSLPGNSGLEVALRRKKGLGHSINTPFQQGFGDWNIDLPIVHIAYAPGPSSTPPPVFDNGCLIDRGAMNLGRSVSGVGYSTYVESDSHTDGAVLHVPGKGLSGYPAKMEEPSDPKSDWEYLERSTDFAGRCATIVVASDGTKYKFGRHTFRQAASMNIPVYQIVRTISDGSVQFGQAEAYLNRDYAVYLITEVEDVHGNWVRYDYTNDSRAEITRIYSNDGREISFQYNNFVPTHTGRNSRLVSSVTVNGRVWNYQYTGEPNSGSGWAELDKAVLPDGRYWRFGDSTQGIREIEAEPWSRWTCLPYDLSFEMKHPDGATGNFTIRETRHIKTATWLGDIGLGDTIGHYVTDMTIPHSTSNEHCEGWSGSPDSSGRYPWYKPDGWPIYRSMSLKSKTISGPGLPTATWDFEYRDYSGGPIDQTWTKITEPDGTLRTYTYQAIGLDFGLLKKIEVTPVSGDGETIEFLYTHNGTANGGNDCRADGDHDSTAGRCKAFDKRLVETRTQDRNAVTYTTEYEYVPDSGDDYYGLPSKITRSSSQGSTPRIVEYDYDHKTDKNIIGLVEAVRRNDREFTTINYNPVGKPTSQNKFGANWESYTYHPDGNVNTLTDAVGSIATFNNFKRGQPRSVTTFDGRTINRVIDDNGWVTSQTNARNYTTGFEYNNVGWLTKVVPPKNDGVAADTLINYTFPVDQNGDLTGMQQTLTTSGLVLTRNYDVRHRVVSEQREDLNDPNAISFQSFEYDFANRMTFESLEEDTLALSQSHGIETEYDGLGRMLSTRQRMAPFAQTSYEFLSGNMIRVTDAENNQTTTTFLTYGRPASGLPEEGDTDVLSIRVDAPLGADATYDYDIWGNKRFDRMVSGSAVLAETEYYFNTRNLLEWTEDPDGDKAYTYYDLKDRPVVEVDGAGRKTRIVYDPMDRTSKLIKAWAGNNAGVGELDCAIMRANYDSATGYLQQCYQLNTYDPNGNLETVTDANGNPTSYTYDALDRPKRVTYPDQSYTEVQQYDAFGNAVLTRTRAGQIHDYKYDALSRLKASSTPNRDSTYTYNGASLRTCAAVYSPNVLDLNNPNNCLAANDNQRLHQTTYTYDVAQRLIAEAARFAGDATSLTTGYAYDKRDLRTRITWPDNFYAQYDYDANGRLTDVKQDGTILLAHYDYDAQSRLDALTYGGNNFAGGSGTSQTSFTWEDDDDLAQLTHLFSASDDVNFTFGYDGSAKLISESADADGWLYAPSSSTTQTYGTANSLNQYPNVNGVALSHDLNGNRTAYNGLSTPHDSENRLLSIGSDVSYAYDADGRRVSKATSTSTTRFAHAGDMEIAEYDGATLLRRYVPGHSVDQRVVMIEAATGVKHYYHANRLGSVQALADAAGAVADQYVYTPFGIEEPLNASGNPFRYTGRRFDPESSLYYYRARYYDPTLGRFLQTDPIGYEDQQNLYAYVANDPLNNIDPTGEDHVTVRFADQKIRVPDRDLYFPQWVSGGHSGSLIIREDGLTKYREYGRYDGLQGPVAGGVRSIQMPNISFDSSGIPTAESLTAVFEALLKIGARAGSTDLRLKFDLSADNYEDMMAEVDRWDEEVPYNVFKRKTCHDFCRSVRDEGRKGNESQRRNRNIDANAVFDLKLRSEYVDEVVQDVRRRYEEYK